MNVNPFSVLKIVVRYPVDLLVRVEDSIFRRSFGVKNGQEWVQSNEDGIAHHRLIEKRSYRRV